MKNASVLAAALHATLQLHTLDAETEEYVASLEVASAETAGDAGLGVRVADGAGGGAPVVNHQPTSSLLPAVEAQTLVATHYDDDELNRYAVAEASVSYAPSSSSSGIAHAVVESPPLTLHQRSRTQTAERSMDL